MPALQRQQYLGYAKESTRNTSVNTATAFFAYSDFTVDIKNEYYENQQVYGRREGQIAKEITRQSVEGSINAALDVDNVLGQLLFHTFGSANSVTALGATTHTFATFLNNVANPTFTLQYTKTDIGFLKATWCGVKTLEIDFGDKDCTVKADFVGIKEETGNSQTVVLTKPTRHLLGKNLTFKTATTVAGLGAAAAFAIRKCNIKIDTGLDYDPALGSIFPNDTRSGMASVEFSFTAVVRSSVFYTMSASNSKNAFEFDCSAANLPVLGTSALVPRLRIRIPPSTLEVTHSSPNDDLITFDAKGMAEFSTVDNYLAEVLLQNVTTSY